MKLTAKKESSLGRDWATRFQDYLRAIDVAQSRVHREASYLDLESTLHVALPSPKFLEESRRLISDQFRALQEVVNGERIQCVW